jgi:hypothetical protein
VEFEPIGVDAFMALRKAVEGGACPIEGTPLAE